MNYRMISYIAGRLMAVEGLLMALPLLVSVIYGEYDMLWAFVTPMALLFAIGLLLSWRKPRDVTIYAKEGFVTVGLSWIIVSLFGCLPYMISGLIPNFIEAFFETVSGFTTTGSSVLSAEKFTNLWSPELVSRGMRGIFFWRSFTNWIGGMGVLVFVLAIMPRQDMASSRLVHVMRAEMPGPRVDKIVSTVKKTSAIMYLIYTAMTAVSVALLMLGGMDLYESLCTSFSVAGTGGFSIWADSMQTLGGGAIQYEYCIWVMSIFMFLFSINFNVYFLLITGKIAAAIFSEELWWFIGVVTAATVMITANIYSTCESLGSAIMHAFFQVTTIISTTGFATQDFNIWPNSSKTILLILMFVGACAGSTGGGMKISRLVISAKSTANEIGRMLHPRRIKRVMFEKKAVDEDTIRGSFAFIVAYVFIFFISFTAISLFDGHDIETSFSAVAACINNIGPGLGQVGPAANFAVCSPATLIVLSFDMLFGRLEIFPMIMLFSPSVWRGK